MDDITFKCSCCGQVISGIADLSYPAPLPYSNLNEKEKSSVAKCTDDFCHIKKKDWFIRAILPIPIIDIENDFAFGIWVSLKKENFQKYWDTFDDQDQSKIGGMFGYLCNALPDYPDTYALKTSVFPRDNNQRPEVWINDDHSDHPLYIDQNNGITFEKYKAYFARNMAHK